MTPEAQDLEYVRSITFTMITALLVSVGVIVCSAILWALYEFKPLVLRDPQAGTVAVAQDEAALLALLDLTYRPEAPGVEERVAAATNAGRLFALPNGTRVTLLNRKFYKDGRLNTLFTLRTAREQEEDEAPGPRVEQVKVVSSGRAGMEVWVDGKYCRRNKLPI